MGNDEKWIKITKDNNQHQIISFRPHKQYENRKEQFYSTRNAIIKKVEKDKVYPVSFDQIQKSTKTSVVELKYIEFIKKCCDPVYFSQMDFSELNEDERFRLIKDIQNYKSIISKKKKTEVKTLENKIHSSISCSHPNLSLIYVTKKDNGGKK